MHVWDATDYRANSRAQLALAQDFLRRIAIPPDARVLDVGCGDGKVTALIRAASVTGCDRSPEMVALARREHPECTFVVADARELPFDAAFDVAVSFTALHWVVDAARRRALGDAPRARARRPLRAQFPGAGNMAELAAAADEVSRPAGVARGVRRVPVPVADAVARGLPAAGRRRRARGRAARAGAARRRARRRRRPRGLGADDLDAVHRPPAGGPARRRGSTRSSRPTPSGCRRTPTAACTCRRSGSSWRRAGRTEAVGA